MHAHGSKHAYARVSTVFVIEFARQISFLHCFLALRHYLHPQQRDNCAPTMLRLAWLDASSYDAASDKGWPLQVGVCRCVLVPSHLPRISLQTASRHAACKFSPPHPLHRCPSSTRGVACGSVTCEQGGANGSVRLVPELDYSSNKGLAAALSLLNPLLERFDKVSMLVCVTPRCYFSHTAYAFAGLCRGSFLEACDLKIHGDRVIIGDHVCLPCLALLPTRSFGVLRSTHPRHLPLTHSCAGVRSRLDPNGGGGGGGHMRRPKYCAAVRKEAN